MLCLLFSLILDTFVRLSLVTVPRRGPGGPFPPFEAWLSPLPPHLSFTDIRQNAVYG